MNAQVTQKARLPELLTVIDGVAVEGEGDPFEVRSPIDGSVLGTPRASSAT